MAHRTSPFRADRQHFHHLLLAAGLTQRQAVLIMYATVAAFGSVALVAGTELKFALFILLALATVLVSSWLIRRARRLS